MDTSKIHFRTFAKPEDIEAVRDIVTSTGFFYHFEIPVAVDLVEDGVNEGDQSDYRFIFAEVDGRTVAYSCYGHIAGTDAGYDLYWIATHNDYRGSGIGKIVLLETEKKAKELGARYIIAETSSLEKYLPTRLFYEKNGYSKDAYIADYYQPGDGKVIYVKRL
ncbi:MAG: GNAT family N-acetyltransferase [Bacteroidetes bacterium]|nr:GNAT family N-acetyltransferase [Bacteroidota bacterium]